MVSKLLFLLGLASAELQIFNPIELAETYNNSKISAVYANYGRVLYGSSQMGYVYYNPENPDGCDRDLSWADDFSDDPDGIASPVFLMERGHCTFVTKTRNVQHHQGAVAVVIDNQEENINNVIMSDDGTGAGLNIPSMMISKKDGDVLKEYILAHKNEK